MDIEHIIELCLDLDELRQQVDEKEAEVAAAISALKLKSKNAPWPKPTAKSSPKIKSNGKGLKGRKGRRRKPDGEVEWRYTGQLYAQAAKALDVGTIARESRDTPSGQTYNYRVAWLTESERDLVRIWSQEQAERRWPRDQRNSADSIDNGVPNPA